jgi:ABC-2 type transport system ATP-binding protein
VSDVVLQALDVHVRHGRHVALAGASLRVRRGSIVAVLGENGSGKSTLLRVLAGTCSPQRGHVVVRGAIGHCPQEQALDPHLTPDEHLEMFARARRLDERVARSRADALFETFGFARDRHRLVQQLSGGTRQKLNLAIALLHDPPVLLLDEPYTGFDVDTYRRFVEHADVLRRRGVSIVLVTHIAFDPGWLDVVLHLRDGKIHDDVGAVVH